MEPMEFERGAAVFPFLFGGVSTKVSCLLLFSFSFWCFFLLWCGACLCAHVHVRLQVVPTVAALPLLQHTLLSLIALPCAPCAGGPPSCLKRHTSATAASPSLNTPTVQLQSANSTAKHHQRKPNNDQHQNQQGGADHGPEPVPRPIVICFSGFTKGKAG